jgi:hypothetical protein
MEMSLLRVFIDTIRVDKSKGSWMMKMNSQSLLYLDKRPEMMMTSRNAILSRVYRKLN